MTNFLNLIWPIVAWILFMGFGTACLCSQRIADKFSPKLPPTLEHVLESLLLHVSIKDINITNRYAKAAILYLVGICFLVWPLFRDYTPFFPTNLKLVARFDDAGIIKSLNSIDESELAEKGIHIDPNWKKLKEGYLATLNGEIRDRFKDTEFAFSDSTQGEGTVFIKTTKASKWLTYEINEGFGKIHWQYDKDKFDTEFNLNCKSVVRLTPKDIYFKYNSIILPEYDQVIYMNPTKATIHHKLIAATKVTIFPLTDVSNSLYLYRGKERKDWVPIGYAEYIF
jgi:hypothetical protein